VGYEGTHGARYTTRFCFYFDKARKKFVPGHPVHAFRSDWNKTVRVDAAERRRREVERLVEAQID
jgi:hypothetical protein